MRYFLGVLIGLGLIVLVFVLILKSFGSGGATQTGQVNLNSYASTNATAQLIIDAPIVGEQEHRSIQITISQYQTELQIIRGYQGSVLHSVAFANNQSAYATFLHALNLQGFTRGNPDPSKQDERGYCPIGDRYIYVLNTGGKDVVHFWSTSCGEGTFGGNAAQVRWLFERQIPQKVFNEMTYSIPLGG